MHYCSELKERKFEIVRSTPYIGLYDTLAHTYVWRIKFCPFCGERL